MIVDAEVAEDLPLGSSPFGHCNDALTLPLPPAEIVRLHEQCDPILWSWNHPDPARKGATYRIPGRRCPCVCHTRPVL